MTYSINTLNVLMYNKYKPLIKNNKLYWEINMAGFIVEKSDFDEINNRYLYLQGKAADIEKLKFIFELLN